MEGDDPALQDKDFSVAASKPSSERFTCACCTSPALVQIRFAQVLQTVALQLRATKGRLTRLGEKEHTVKSQSVQFSMIRYAIYKSPEMNTSSCSPFDYLGKIFLHSVTPIQVPRLMHLAVTDYPILTAVSALRINVL